MSLRQGDAFPMPLENARRVLEAIAKGGTVNPAAVHAARVVVGEIPLSRYIPDPQPMVRIHRPVGTWEAFKP